MKWNWHEYDLKRGMPINGQEITMFIYPAIF